MRRSRLGVFGAFCAIVAVGAAATGTAPAASTPSASAAQVFATGSPTSIACGGSVDAKVTITGTAGTTGQATDVMLVLDLSGSTADNGKLTDLQHAATDTLDALDAADGTTDQTISGNRAGVEIYQGSGATVVAQIGSSYGDLLAAINGGSPSGGSPHSVGISTATAALTAPPVTGNAKAIVLISDGQASGGDLSAATTAAGDAKTAGVHIVPLGLGASGDVSDTNLRSWAYDGSFYQSATAARISKSKLTTDLGIAVATPVQFSLAATLGSAFAASNLTTATGTATTSAGSLQWNGTLTGSQSATLTYHATRNGTDVFSPTNEVVSTITSFSVAGGSGSITAPAAISIGVLPCGGSPVAATTCTGASCTLTGSSGGQQFVLDAGRPAAGTSVVVTGLSTTPPPGACPGFDSSTSGIEFDISPLTKDATFTYTIPKAQLGNRKWWQLDVCLGTNLKFTTAINSIANLRPGARLVGGGTLPSRYWGLLPSLPRLVQIPGLGWVRGPWITRRSQDRAGNATVSFVVPFVPGSAPFTTDGKPGFDPKRWG